MAVITGIATANVCRVFPDRDSAVMTGRAGANYLRMINCKCRRKHVRCVAILTYIAGLNVREILARRINAVVAVDAVARNIHVVEIRG